MVRVVVGGAGSLVGAGVVVGIGAGVEVAMALVGTDVVGFVAGVGTAVTSEFVGLGAGIVRTGTDVGAVGTPVGTIVALGTGEMVVGVVVESMRSGVSLVIWPEASVAVSSSHGFRLRREPRSHGIRGRCRSRAGQKANQDCNGLPPPMFSSIQAAPSFQTIAPSLR